MPKIDTLADTLIVGIYIAAFAVVIIGIVGALRELGTAGAPAYRGRHRTPWWRQQLDILTVTLAAEWEQRTAWTGVAW